MAVVTASLSDFRSRFPAFSDVSDDTINYYLQEAEDLEEISEHIWGKVGKKAFLLLVAHRVAIAERTKDNSNPVGGVNSRSVGDLSLSIQLPQSRDGTEAWYNSSVYGQEYYALLRQQLPSIMVLNDA